MPETLKFEPGYLNIISARAEVARETMFDAIQKQLGESTAEREAALVVWIDRDSLAFQAQRKLASVIKLNRIVTVLQPPHPNSRAVFGFLKDYLTKPGAKQFNSVYIDTASFDIHPMDKRALIDFSNDLKLLLSQLGMYGFIAFPIQETAEQSSDAPSA